MEQALSLPGLIASAIMGIFLGVFGAGGSILTVPILLYFYGIEPREATHYSLLIVGITGAAGTIRDWESGKLAFRKLLWFATPAMVGMYLIRSVFLPQIPSNLLIFGTAISLNTIILVVFSIFMIAAALSMLFLKIQEVDGGEWSFKHKIKTVIVGALIGFITGFLGAGGGFLIVPALVFLLGLSILDGTRASLFVIALNSLWGFFSAANFSGVPWALLFAIVAAAIVGMFIGIQVREKLPAAKLKPAFGVFVLVMGVAILWKTR